MAALFSAGVPNSARSNESKNLIEFKAGKMELKGTKVVADKRKGTFYIHKERETMLTHVCWKDRSSGVIEDDLIVFPDDCHWSKVTQCKTGRVYILRFTNSSKKLFFWMQEPKDIKDDEYSTKINKILNEPDDGGNGADMMANLSSASTEQLLSQMFGASGGNSAQEQMLQQFFQSGALGPRLGAANAGDPRSRARSARTSETNVRPSRPVSSQAPAPIQLAEFQDIMSNLSGNNQEPTSSGAEQVNLAAALPLDLTSLLSSEEVLGRLTPHVPQEPSDLIQNVNDELKQSLNSPQFRQALSMFSTAFSSGQLGPIISQLNLGEDACNAASSGNLNLFVDALNKSGNNIKVENTDCTEKSGDPPSAGDESSTGAATGEIKAEGSEPMEQENEEDKGAEKGSDEDKEMDTS